jgi:hypothetical protein
MNEQAVQVVNLKAYQSVAGLDQAFGVGQWHYVGRANRSYGLAASPLANPYRLDDGYSREGAIGQYRHWLWARLQAGDEAVREALRVIQPGQVLVCWCRPCLCHADVISAAWQYLRQQDASASEPWRVVVAGSRSFTDYPRLARTLDRLLQHGKDVTILSGTARGADRLGERYACERGLAVKQLPADWAASGRRAGYLRNEALLAEATHVVVFWDGASPGSRHLLERARTKGIPLRVMRF